MLEFSMRCVDHVVEMEKQNDGVQNGEKKKLGQFACFVLKTGWNIPPKKCRQLRQSQSMMKMAGEKMLPEKGPRVLVTGFADIIGEFQHWYQLLWRY